MDNRFVRVPVRHTGRVLAVLMLVVALVIISLAPMASAETVVQAATVLGDKPAGDAPSAVGLDAWSCPDNLLLNPSFELGSGSFNSFWGDPVPANWTLQGSGFTGATTAYGAADGIRIGYVIHTSPAEHRRDHVPAGSRGAGDYV